MILCQSSSESHQVLGTLCYGRSTLGTYCTAFRIYSGIAFIKRRRQYAYAGSWDICFSFIQSVLRDIYTPFQMFLLSTMLDFSGSFPIPSSDCLVVTWFLSQGVCTSPLSLQLLLWCPLSDSWSFRKVLNAYICTCVYVYAHTHPTQAIAHSRMHTWTASFASTNHFGDTWHNQLKKRMSNSKSFSVMTIPHSSFR